MTGTTEENRQFLTHIAGLQLTAPLFWAASGSTFIFAATAGSFAPKATSTSSIPQLLISSQSFTFLLLIGAFLFLHAGIKNSHHNNIRSKLWIVRIVAPSFLGAHFIATFGSFLGIG